MASDGAGVGSDGQMVSNLRVPWYAPAELKGGERDSQLYDMENNSYNRIGHSETFPEIPNLYIFEKIFEKIRGKNVLKILSYPTLKS